MFADDTKMVSKINPSSAIEDSQSLKKDIDSVFTLSDTWSMKLNPLKCKIMHLGKRNPNHNYTVSSHDGNTHLPLESTSHQRDL